MVRAGRLRLEVGAADFSGCSVLDLGCGTGDLKAYLDERFAALRYLGIDPMPQFIEAARPRFATQPDTAFALAHFDTVPLPSADIVVASGALGYRCADPRVELVRGYAQDDATIVMRRVPRS